MGTIETGALEQMYARVETAFKVSPADALAGSDGIRHITALLATKKNRTKSPEKRGTPDYSQSLPTRQTSTFNISEIYWEPSGTPAIISNVGKFLKAGFGAQTTPALTTTVAAAPAPTDTGCTLTSGAGLAVGDLMIFTTGAGTKREVTRLKTVAGAAVTFDALTVAPDVPGVATSQINFKLANNLTDTLAIYEYFNAGGFKQAVYGAVVDKITITIDGTKQVSLAFDGPAADFADATVGTVQAKPATHVTVGAPLGGMVGSFCVDGADFPVISVALTLTNQELLRNKEIGTSVATGIAGRNAMRDCTVSLVFYLDNTALIAKANTVVRGVLRCVVGDTDGTMVALVCPSVEFEVPDIPNTIGPKEVTIAGICYADLGNDQVILAEA